MTQHAGLSTERWALFSIDQQILMIANEMQRGSGLLSAGRVEPLRNCYERILRLVDLTAQGSRHRGLRRELLRWRDLAAELFLAELPDEATHRAAFRALLLLRPEAAKQIPFLLG